MENILMISLLITLMKRYRIYLMNKREWMSWRRNMGYEGSCRKFEDLCKDVGAAEANRMLDDDPFMGCLYDPNEDSDNAEYLFGQRRPTSDEEDEFMEMDAMNDGT